MRFSASSSKAKNLENSNTNFVCKFRSKTEFSKCQHIWQWQKYNQSRSLRLIKYLELQSKMGLMVRTHVSLWCTEESKP